MTQRRPIPRRVPESGGIDPVGSSSKRKGRRLCKIRMRHCLPSTSATLTMAIVGSVNGWTTTSLLYLISGTGSVPLTLTNGESSWIVSFTVLGSMIGSLVAAQFAGRRGRKNCLVLCNTMFTLGWFIIYAATSVPMLYLARGILGIGVGIACTINPMYVPEVADFNIRTIPSSLNVVKVSIGTLLTCSLGLWLMYKSLLQLLAITSFISFLLNTYFPEIPYFSVATGQTGQTKQASKSLEYYQSLINTHKLNMELYALSAQTTYELQPQSTRESNQPSTSQMHRSSTSQKHRPSTSEIHQPSTSQMHRSSLSAMHQPSTSQMHQSSSSEIYPDPTSQMHRSSTRQIHRPSTSEIHQPSTSQMHRSSTSQIHRTSTSEIDQSSTSQMHRPSTSQIHRTSSSEKHQPSTSQMHRSSTSQTHRSSTSQIHQPSTSEIHQPSTSQMHRSSSSEIYPGPTCEIQQQSTSQIYQPSISETHQSSTTQTSPQYIEIYPGPTCEIQQQSTSQIYQPSISETHQPSTTQTSPKYIEIYPDSPSEILPNPTCQILSQSRNYLCTQSYEDLRKWADIDETHIDLTKYNWSTKLHALLQRSNRKALFIMLGLTMAQQLSGNFITMQYLLVLFGIPTISLEISAVTILVLAVGLITGIFSILTAKSVGRRTLLLLSTLGLCLILVSLATYLLLFQYKSNVSILSPLPVIDLITYQVLFHIGLGTLPNVLLSELFPTELKGFVGAIIVIFDGIIGFTVPKLYQVITDNVGSYANYFIFATSCCLAFLMVLIWVPETRGKTYKEIEAVLVGKNLKSLNEGVRTGEMDIPRI